MAYNWTTGSVRRGDIYFEDDDDDNQTYIDFGQDSITLRPGTATSLYATPSSVSIGSTVTSSLFNLVGTDPTITFIEDNSIKATIGVNSADNILIENKVMNKHIVFKANDQGVVREGLRLDGAVPEVVVNQQHGINGDNSLIDFRVESDNNTHMFFVDGSADKVGVNTSSPAETLHVAGNLKVAGDDVRIKIDGDTDSHPGVELYENGTRKWIVFNDYTNDNLTFKTDSNTRMSIEQAGNVGIGTTAPIAKLDVAGKIAITAESSTPGTPADGQGYIYSKSDGKLYWRSYDLAETDLTATGGGGGGTPGGSDSMIQYNDGGSFNGAQGLVYDDSNTRVGIGITAPLSTLHVHADTINNGAVTISQADNSGDASQLDLSKARGTGASPTAVQSSDYIGQVRMLGYDGNSYDNFADIYAQAAGTISTTSHPTKIVIRTTQASATSPTTAVTIDENQDMTVAGAVYGKMRHMTHHRYNDGSGKLKEYIPWSGTSELSSPSWITQGVAPYNGRLVKVLVRATIAHGQTDVGIHMGGDGDSVVNTTAEETVSLNAVNTNTTYTYTFANSNHFAAGDVIGVSIDPTNAHGNVNVTCVWEYDITV